MIITFVGHSHMQLTDRTKDAVKQLIRSCITENETIYCYLGGYVLFDELCACACRELKAEHLPLELIYVTPYLSISEQEKISTLQKFGLYDSTIYPPIEKTPPKFAILKRNEWMISNADLVIAYVKTSFGGAYKSLQIAKRKKKKTVNLFEIIE